MAIVLTTAPEVEPVTLAEMKDHLDFEDTGKDTYITSLIKACRALCEQYTGLTIPTQTWTLWLDRFPESSSIKNDWWDGVRQGANVMETAREVEIPKAPLQTITYLKTYDTDDSASTFAAASYTVDAASRPGRIVLKTGYTWPSSLRTANAIEVEFVAGMTDVDDDIIWAIKALGAHMFENPGDELVAQHLPAHVQAILNTHRMLTI
tara:strand:+ start:1390 stop:2010 length:621 start_codon:yes stop_codon:yes gene_type:complete